MKPLTNELLDDLARVDRPAFVRGEGDARIIRHAEMEGPIASTSPHWPFPYEAIPRPPHPPMRWT